jgi:hypothetical protein
VAKPLAREVARHVTRGRPRRRPLDEPRAAAAPGADAPAASPTPAAPPAPATPTPWHELGKTLKALADPIYVSLGAQVVPEIAWAGFAEAWGRVVDHYLPAFQQHPLPPALVTTVIVALPLAEALRERAVKRRAAAAAVTPAPADEIKAAAA